MVCIKYSNGITTLEQATGDVGHLLLQYSCPMNMIRHTLPYVCELIKKGKDKRQ
jgi:hypothetical protein